jgi:HSP20 family molecular chaperone IbpA
MSKLRDISESVGTAVLENVGRAMGRAQEQTPLAVDLLESDDAYLAVFDAPGAQRSDVQVQYDAGALEVRVDRFRGFHEGFEMRYPGRGLALDGRVELPEGATVDPAEATATLRDNGTLAVRVPKVDEAVESDADDSSEAVDDVAVDEAEDADAGEAADATDDTDGAAADDTDETDDS